MKIADQDGCPFFRRPFGNSIADAGAGGSGDNNGLAL